MAQLGISQDDLTQFIGRRLDVEPNKFQYFYTRSCDEGKFVNEVQSTVTSEFELASGVVPEAVYISQESCREARTQLINLIVEFAGSVLHQLSSMS